MIEMTMQAALLLYTTCFLLGFIIMYLYSRHIEMTENLRYFLSFFLLSGLASLIIFFRAEINNLFISVFIANSMLVVGYLMLGIGITRLIDINIRIELLWVPYILFVVPFIIFTYVDPNVIVRTVVYNSVVTIILLRIIYHIQKTKPTERFWDELMSPVLALNVIMIVFRTVSLFIFKETSNDFLAFQRDSFSIAILGIVNVFILVGLFSLINRKIQSDLVESERSKSSLLSNLPGFAYRCLPDEYWTMKFLSDGFKQVTGYKNDEVIDNLNISFEDIIAPEFQKEVRDAWRRCIATKRPYVGEYKIRQANGNQIWIWEQGIGIYNSDGECVALEGFIADIDSRKTLERNLEFLSYRDSLTGLYNRRFMEDQIQRLNHSRNLPISIIVADVNGLKFINDSFGHDHGDLIIQNVANIFRQTIRSSELIARLGGDEFLIILENTSKDDCEKVVDRIQKESSKSEYQKLGLSIAIGFDTKTVLEDRLSDTRKEAENQMYREKLYSKPSTRSKAIDTVTSTLFEKDELSEIHSRNVAKYAKQLATHMKLSDHLIKQVETAALLHDVGKIIISDSILKSTGTLTEEEWNEMRKHPEIGYRILNSNPDLSQVATIILSHHERYDGKGYPNQIAGEEIPLLSRVITICDAFDAMTHKRLYKKTLTKKEAKAELIANKGTQFDPNLVDLFIEIM